MYLYRSYIYIYISLQPMLFIDLPLGFIWMFFGTSQIFPTLSRAFHGHPLHSNSILTLHRFAFQVFDGHMAMAQNY